MVPAHRFNRGACSSSTAWLEDVTANAQSLDRTVGLAGETTIDAFAQVGSADSACRARPRTENDIDYYDRWFTDEFTVESHLVCERRCVEDFECVAYEFAATIGRCETWRVGPVFESPTNGPRRQGGTEALATNYTCWQRIPGGRVGSASISGCPWSTAAIGLLSMGVCAVILVAVCLFCAAQKKRVGDVTIDQSGFIPQADVDLSQTGPLSPEQIRAMERERDALEAALGVSPRSNNVPELREHDLTVEAGLQSRIGAANAQSGTGNDGSSSEVDGDELRAVATTSVDEPHPSAPAPLGSFVAAPPSAPLSPVSPRPPPRSIPGA